LNQAFDLATALRSSSLSGSSSMGAFEHTDRGGHLVWGKVLDQFVGVLFICRHNKAILHRDIYGT
jgi:hypothetical protein